MDFHNMPQRAGVSRDGVSPDRRIKAKAMTPSEKAGNRMQGRDERFGGCPGTKTTHIFVSNRRLLEEGGGNETENFSGYRHRVEHVKCV